MMNQVLNSRTRSSRKEEDPISFGRQVFTSGSNSAAQSAFRAGKNPSINISVSREVHDDDEALHIPMSDVSITLLIL